MLGFRPIRPHGFECGGFMQFQGPGKANQARLNGIEMEVLWNRLVAIADEMATTLVRTSHSTLVREGNDFSCVVMDARGRALAQSTRSIPSFTVLLPRTVKAMLEVMPSETWQPGDVVITNDPWIANGHLPDLTMVMPVFIGDDLAAFTGTVAHLPDIGGQQMSGAGSEIYEEGLRLPVVRLYRAGRLDHTLWDVIGQNVRVSDQVYGDLDAQRATNNLGVRRLHDLVDDLGIVDLGVIAEQIQELSENAFRRAISAVPDGEYRGTADGDGFDGPVHIELCVRVRGDSLDLDFSGTSPRSNRGHNVPLSYTAAYALYALKCVLDPHTPSNEGCFTPVTVSAPAGSILNAQPPAAVAARHTVGHLVPSAVFSALWAALPGSVPAESGTPLWAMCFTGQKNGRNFSIFPSFNGGQGASRAKDGLPCLSFPSNSSNTPVEVVEALTTLRVVEKRLLPHSGGTGARRGGAGQRIVLRATGDSPIKVSMFTDKIVTRAFGLDGGGSGQPGAVSVNGNPVLQPKGELVLHAEDELEIVLPGGGGYGRPEPA
jgi:N-methylhydantoinase B